MTSIGPRLRVAYFVPPSKHFAGVERVVHDIATGLAEQHADEFDVHVVFASAYDERVLDRPPYTKHVLGVSRLRGLVGALRACAKAERFDVLICPQVEPSVIAWLATRGLGLPAFVPHLHGNPRIEEAGGSRRTRAAFVAFRHVVGRRCAAVLAVSPSLAEYARGTIARHVPVHYVENPVRAMAGEPPAREPGRLRLVGVARLSRQKGQDLLLRALAAARPEIPGVHLTLVGNGPEEAALQRLCHELELDDVVDFAGYATDPGRFLAQGDVFVLASRWEGFGVALVEALSFGLPVLATDCDFGPGDVVTDERTGILVDPDDVEGLTEGLRRAAGQSWTPEDVGHRRAVAAGWSQEAATAAHRRILHALPVPRARRTRSPQPVT